MSNTINIGRRLIPLEQIALVEPFEPSAENPLRSDREFKSRIVLLNRDSVLAEIDSLTFAEQHGFRVLEEDAVASNPALHSFAVEAFQPSADFQPSKPFRSRLVWRDRDGNTQSKLLLSGPETVLASVVRGGQEPDNHEGGLRAAGNQKSRRSAEVTAASEHQNAGSDLGRVPSGRALSALRTEPLSRLGPSGDDPSRKK
jgi:hypothetical protein